MSQRITIQITKKIATCLTELPIVCGNSDYECEFIFDEEWDKNSIKTARFKWNGEYADAVFEGSVCKMPIISSAKIVWIGVFAGELSTSTPAIVHCKPSILDGEDTPAPPREDVYSQILSMYNEVVDIARDVEEKANNGYFDGEDGDDYVLTDTDKEDIAYIATAELQQQIGDIDAALDVILAKHASVLGGDT